MRETGTSITEYLQFYKESWSDLQSLSHPGRQYQQGNMLQTWMISYREIQKRDLNAAKLLLLLACFDNRDIWYELVKSGSHSNNTPAWFDKIISTPLAFKISMKTLIGFSLIETTQRVGSYTMHPIMQDWCLHITDKEHDLTGIQLNELALVSVGYMVPSNREGNYWELQRRLLAHAYYVHYRWNNDQLTSDIAIWDAFHGLGNLYSDQGKLKEAEEMYQRALVGYDKALGPDHTSTLFTVNSLGNIYRNQGKLKEAEEMFQRALAGYEKALGPDHMSTLLVVNNLGNLYRNQGKLKEAEEMYQRALVGREKALGPDHTSTLNSVHCLGILYSNQGKLKKAEEMFQRALIGHEKALSPDHMSTLLAVNNLGNLYSDQGKLKKAEEMYQQALVGCEKALGPDHISTLYSVHCLGILYSDQGKLKEAEEMYQRALVGYEKALGPNHHMTQRVAKDFKALVKL
jgi:tetratricopeptide (TPR) repeat protein